MRTARWVDGTALPRTDVLVPFVVNSVPGSIREIGLGRVRDENGGWGGSRRREGCFEGESQREGWTRVEGVPENAKATIVCSTMSLQSSILAPISVFYCFFHILNFSPAALFINFVLEKTTAKISPAFVRILIYKKQQ